jgi:tetrapyrrole methylase family protein/MazG family protein
MTDHASSNGHQPDDDSILESLDIGMQILHGRELAMYVQDEFSGGAIPVIPDFAVTITDVESPGATDSAFAILSRVFPLEHPVILQSEAIPATGCTLAELTSLILDSDDPTNLFVPPLTKLGATRSPHTLQYIVSRLRAEDGCPWDREQNHATLRDAVINEAYEVLDAIDAADWENLAEELGDLFLLVAMHAQIAEEAGEFTLEDVYDGINTKIIRRHPHVFGDAAADTPEAVLKNWNEIKAQEKAAKPPRQEKAADGQPRSMPALTRAARVLKKHPVGNDTGTDEAGDAMLRLISDMVQANQDPETVLRDALARHTGQ